MRMTASTVLSALWGVALFAGMASAQAKAEEPPPAGPTYDSLMGDSAKAKESMTRINSRTRILTGESFQ